MIRSAVKRLLRSFGIELIRSGSASENLPSWIRDPEPLKDEAIPSEWQSGALQMANRRYRPPRLAYARMRYGDDQRLKYVLYFLDVRDQRVLELGAFEGHHSIILEKLGVRETVAVEGRADNFAKCQRVKEKFGLDRTSFVLQDIEALVNGTAAPQFSGPFDLVFCCGLLYHLPEPAQALGWFRRQAPILFLGTHYVEVEAIRRYEAPMFTPQPYVHNGHTYRAMRYQEGGLGDPISGLSEHSIWPYEPDLLQMLRDAGYRNVSVLGKDMQNRTPHVTILAEASR